MSLSLWSWAVEAYARPGVSDACLSLQDDHGQNVCLLLWAAWRGPVDEASLREAAGLTRQWQDEVVAPLRSVRRNLKPSRPPIDAASRERLRREVKAAELQAEKLLLEALEGLGAPAKHDAVLGALAAAAAAWGAPPPPQALSALSAVLEVERV